MYTNDAAHPVSDLIISGPVRKFANVSPARVVFNGEVGDPLKVEVKVSPVTKGLFEIIEAKADRGQDIRITLTKPSETNDAVYVLTVENIRKTLGRYQDIIRLRTTDKAEGQQEIIVPVWGNIRAPQIADIKPRHIALRGTAGTPIKGTVTVTAKDKYPFSITEVKAHSGKHIQWDLQETETDGKKIYTLTVENLLKEKGRYYDSIFLKTDNAQMPEMRISVSGIIMDAGK